MDRTRGLAGDLRRWASSEMHFHPQGKFVTSRLPTEQQLQDVCIGQMADMWKFLISHVRSAQTVRKVKGNLALKSLQEKVSKHEQVTYKSAEQYSAERAQLLEQRRHLAREVAGMVTDISVVETEVHRLQRDILHTEQGYQESHDQVQGVQRRRALLEAHNLKCRVEREKIDEINRRIQNKTDNIQEKNRSADNTVYYNQNAQSQNKNGHESACSAEVKEVCDTVNAFLNRMLAGEFSSDPSLLQSNREQMLVAVETLSSNHAIQNIVDSLVTNTRDSTHSLRDKTLRIDITRDAQRLDFRYEQGHLTDVSMKPSLLQNVKQLIEEAEWSHVQRFMQTEKHKNAALRLQSRLDAAREELHHQLTQSLRGKPDALQLAKKLVETEIELAANEATFSVLNSASAEVQQKMQRLSQEKQDLYAKYKKIQSFKSVADSKQNLIRVLVKQNVNSRENMQAQQTEINDYILKKSLSERSEGVTVAMDQLQGGVSKEVETFSSLALPALLTTTTDSGSRTAVQDLSINRLSLPLKSPGYHMIDKLLAALKFPLHKAPECMLPQAVELLKQQTDLHSSQLSHKTLLQQLQGGESNSQQLQGGERNSHAQLLMQIQDLCHAAQTRNRDKVLPLLQKRINQVSQVLLDFIQVKDTAQMWWDQPAQHTTLFLKVEDLTLQQWREKWIYNVARLRQLQLQQQQRK